MLTLDATEQHALCAGLEFAWLMRAHFPDFYGDQVMTRPTRHYDLLGVVGAFLSLAHQELLALETQAVSPIPFKPSDPTEPLRHYLAPSTSLYYLAEFARAWLRPVPRVYGLTMEEIAPPVYLGRTPIEKHALALALWRMLGATPWATLDDGRTRSLAVQSITNKELGRLVVEVQPLPRETPLVALCARLDRERPCGIGQLGTMVAYAARRTGNGYADHTRMELRDHAHRLLDLDWYLTAEAFGRERGEQQAAAKWSSAYSRLDGRLYKTPELLADVRQAIWTTAQEVCRTDGAASNRGVTYDPRLLSNHLVDIDRGDDEAEIDATAPGGAPALAAAAAAPVPA